MRFAQHRHAQKFHAALLVSASWRIPAPTFTKHQAFLTDAHKTHTDQSATNNICMRHCWLRTWCYNELMDLKKIRLSEGEISYLEAGTGPDLLFLHGAIATSEGYLPLLTLLGQTYHIIAPIHPGHGVSFPVPRDWKLTDFVRFYQDFLIEVSCTPTILLGHSFGGTIALLLSARATGTQVIAMDAPGIPFQFELAQYAKALIVEARQMIEKRPDLEQLLETTKAAGTLVQTMAHHPDVLFLFTKEGPKFNIHRELRRITSPVALFWGELDHVVPLEIGTIMEQIIPNAHLTVFPGLGHNYSVTDPEFTYQEIMKALRKQRQET